ncbi:unnamed protein product [Rotaria sp. Silwood2]|nr:unnamed protein product [Rotaria sp. Silwood2]CAF2969444.1 unnamed protein product [Rotaria sp. Silwood2]CAF3304258.1 unnamed protein product [Rotaria sp. Silwood2]CAF3994749.1 unnamed protein product [Rotaria sp. Silwood2]CAF3995828.1 unnamed protein product [Rotaria sp. Silwood2]
MSNDNDNFNYSNNSFLGDHESISNVVKFWVYLIFLIPSIICSMFALYYLLWNRTLRHALHNHAIIIFLSIGLTYEVTIYPWMLLFFYKEGIWERTHFFCSLWLFIDWGLYYTQTILFAWATMERHILIFHDKWVSTKTKRLLVHYMPLAILAFYCLIYYSATILFPPCKNTFNGYIMICVDGCLFKSFLLHTYDTVTHQIVPHLIIVGSSIGLLIRIRWQKHRIGQSLKWRKHWKMTVQLLFVSIIYLIFGLPSTLLHLLSFCGVSNYVTVVFSQYALFLNYCTILLCPIASAVSLPQLRNERMNFLRLRGRGRAVAPIT